MESSASHPSKNIAARSIDAIRRNGLLYSCAIAFNHLIPAQLCRYRKFVIYQLDAGALAATPEKGTDGVRDVGPPVELQWCDTSAQYSTVEELTYFKRSHSTGRARACYARVEDHPAGGMWATTEYFDEAELGVRIRLAPRQVWLFAAFVRKEYRQLGIYKCILRFVGSELASRGTNHLLVAVNPANIASNRVHAKHAIRRLGTVRVLRIFQFAVCFTRGDIVCDRSISLSSQRHPIEIRCESRDVPVI